MTCIYYEYGVLFRLLILEIEPLAYESLYSVMPNIDTVEENMRKANSLVLTERSYY